MCSTTLVSEVLYISLSAIRIYPCPYDDLMVFFIYPYDVLWHQEIHNLTSLFHTSRDKSTRKQGYQIVFLFYNIQGRHNNTDITSGE